MRAIEPTDAAVGRGDPEEPLAVLVEVFDVHPAQPIKDRVVLAYHVLKGNGTHARPFDAC